MPNPLSSCVSSLRSSTQFLSSSISILDSGVNDFPRLAKVLGTTRHFELLPTSTLSAAQASLIASITPEITSLFSRVKSHLDRLERREQALIARYSLLEGRLSHGEDGGELREMNNNNSASEGARESLRLKQMRQKKEMLVYAVERLQMQAQQKVRQLRMSMAAQ